MKFEQALLTITAVKLSLSNERLRQRMISNLKILMAANHLSQSAIARMVGVKKPSVSMFMTGKRGRQPLGLFLSIADKLGVKDVNVLFEKDFGKELRRLVSR